jgi:hypothetical protein
MFLINSSVKLFAYQLDHTTKPLFSQSAAYPSQEFPGAQAIDPLELGRKRPIGVRFNPGLVCPFW